MKKMNCPKCNSSKIAKFLYGLQMLSPKLDKEIKRGVIILGGCIIHPDNPDFKCQDCGREFKKTEVRKDEY